MYEASSGADRVGFYYQRFFLPLSVCHRAELADLEVTAMEVSIFREFSSVWTLEVYFAVPPGLWHSTNFSQIPVPA